MSEWDEYRNFILEVSKSIKSWPEWKRNVSLDGYVKSSAISDRETPYETLLQRLFRKS